MFDPSIQRVVPVAVPRPVTFKNESASVLIVTPLVLFGEKVLCPLAVKVCPLATVAPPLAVIKPVAVKALLTVVVPVEAPRAKVVAAPPTFKVVAVVLNRSALVLVVVIEPPLTATFPPAVTLPVRVDVLSIVSVPLAWILPELEMETPVVPYPPPITAESIVVTAPAALIAVAFGKLKVALLIVAVPVAAPKARVVAAPPMFKVVAPVLNRLPVVLVVVTEPPLTATLAAAVTLPVRVDVPSMVKLPLA